MPGERVQMRGDSSPSWLYMKATYSVRSVDSEGGMLELRCHQREGLGECVT